MEILENEKSKHIFLKKLMGSTAEGRRQGKESVNWKIEQ